MPESYTTKMIKILTEDAEEFEELYPQYGAWTWFVQKALRNFLNLHSDNSSELIELAVVETKNSLEEENDGVRITADTA